MDNLSLARLKKVFLIGIKGVGMASLAYIFDDLGIQVVGSDVKTEFITDKLLKKRSFKIYTDGFNPENINQERPDLVIATGAHQGSHNPQFLQALGLKIPSFSQAQVLGWLMSLKPVGISIAGVGGKTTITALISHIFLSAGMDPACSIGTGSVYPDIWPGRWGRGDYFIAEADEYATCPLTDHRPRFFWQKPKYLVLTNVEYDHPDIYKDINQTLKTFTRLAEKTLKAGGWLISFCDNANNQKIMANLKRQGYEKIITYGSNPDANWQVQVQSLTYPLAKAKLKAKDQEFKLAIKLPGRHNLTNAAAAFIVAYLNQIPPDKILAGLSNFSGVQRRAQLIKKNNQYIVYDDYAHHPNEVKTSLLAMKQWHPNKRIAVIFQSHTISRTKALIDDFAQVLTCADDILIAPIFASAREKLDEVDYQSLIYEKTKLHLKDGQNLAKINRPEDFEQITARFKKKPEVVVTMGAGDIYTWGSKIVW